MISKIFIEKIEFITYAIMHDEQLSLALLDLQMYDLINLIFIVMSNLENFDDNMLPLNTDALQNIDKIIKWNM